MYLTIKLNLYSNPNLFENGFISWMTWNNPNYNNTKTNNIILIYRHSYLKILIHFDEVANQHPRNFSSSKTYQSNKSKNSIFHHIHSVFQPRTEKFLKLKPKRRNVVWFPHIHHSFSLPASYWSLWLSERSNPNKLQTQNRRERTKDIVYGKLFKTIQ